MSSVIVPDLHLHLDEIGLPRRGAMEIFKPFVVKELVTMGFTPLKAREEVDKKSAIANRALEVVASKRPVLFKRDPVLHKFGIMGLKVKLQDESSIHIHPLHVGGFGADFDGDTMRVFVPVTNDAVEETYKMMPAKNLFNQGSGSVMYQPTLEGQLGLFLLTQMGKETDKKFPTNAAALAAAKSGDIRMTDRVNVDGKVTTAGRITFYNILPDSLKKDEYLTDPKQTLDGKTLQRVMREIATKTPNEFPKAIDGLKDLGFAHAYNVGFSFKASDFETLQKIRDKHLHIAEAKVKALSPRMAKADRNKEIIAAYKTATTDMSAEAKTELEQKGNALYTMYSAGVKPGWAQLQQLLLAPMLLQNAKGETIPVPVTRSYSEGLDSSGYWVASSGARKGLIEKVQSVSRPGALSKQIMNTVIPYVVTTDDCGTEHGIALDTHDREVLDRYTVKPIKVSDSITLPPGTLVTPSVMASLSAAKISKIVVRSPLKCSAPKGLCAKCYGAFEDGKRPAIGANLGAIAGQSLGERSVQISMKQFHMGGIAGSGGGLVNSMDRLTQLLKLPSKVPGAAVLSPVSDTIKSITPDPSGGYSVRVGSADLYVPASRKLSILDGDTVRAAKVGDTVHKGQAITDGLVNPRELLEYTNVDTVQRYLTDELQHLFVDDGYVRRRNVEVVAKAITNLGVVQDAGDVEGPIRGDYVSLSHANELNGAAAAEGKAQMHVTPVLRGIETLALDQSTDWMARLQYRKLKDTLIHGASEGWSSDIHGLHPAPGIAYTAEFGKDPSKKSPY